LNHLLAIPLLEARKLDAKSFENASKTIANPLSRNGKPARSRRSARENSRQSPEITRAPQKIERKRARIAP